MDKCARPQWFTLVCLLEIMRSQKTGVDLGGAIWGPLT